MKVDAKNVKLKNGMEMVLRSPAPAEAGLMLEHLRRSHSQSYRNLNQSGAFYEKMSIEEEAKILTEFESAPNRFLITAFFAGRIIGGLGFVGGHAEFTKRNGSFGMSIQEEFCGSGLGTELVGYMLEVARRSGFHRVELTVRTYNPAGIRLYEKMGFQRIGLLKEVAFIDGEYVDEYSYQRLLK